MFYVTFHGGRVSNAINNVHAYDVINGEPTCVTTAALQTPAKSPPLNELRDIVFGPGDRLYVINGYKDASQVLVYNGKPDADHTHAYLGIYADARVSDGVVHPFALAFDGSDRAYVSSQDSNVVTALQAPGGVVKRARTLPLASFLKAQKGKRFLDGTFVASSIGDLPASPRRAPSNLSRPAGLDVLFEAVPSKKKPKRRRVAHSVRDVVVCGTSLYVADEPGNTVKIYDLRNGKTQGQLQGQIADAQFLGAPVHLLAQGEHLYIGSSATDTVLRYHLGTGELRTVLSGVRTIAGMCFDNTGNFYVASREDRAIYHCGTDFSAPQPFISGLADNPEFLVYAASSASTLTSTT
jgi:hypothetical protein